MPWSVARTLSNCESLAADNLKTQGFVIYLPRFLRPPKYDVAPLFPGYLFVEFVDRWHEIFRTHGIFGMLMAGEKPALVRDHEYENLRAKENQNGLIKTEILFPQKRRTRFRKGQLVNVVSGPLIGRQGTVAYMTGKERVSVLFDMLGRSTPVMLRADVLTVI